VKRLLLIDSKEENACKLTAIQKVRAPARLLRSVTLDENGEVVIPDSPGELWPKRTLERRVPS